MAVIDRPRAGLQAVDARFLHRLMAQAAAHDRGRALFLGGSHAAKTTDEHSDLDLYLITADGSFDDFRDERWTFMRSLGDAVVFEDHQHFGFLMLLYAYTDGVYGEIAVAPVGTLRRSSRAGSKGRGPSPISPCSTGRLSPWSRWNGDR